MYHRHTLSSPLFNQKELLRETKEHLNKLHNQADLVRWLKNEPDLNRRIELARLAQEEWHRMEKLCIEPAVYDRGNEIRYTWHRIDETIKLIIRNAQEEMAEREQEAIKQQQEEQTIEQNSPSKNTNHSSIPENPMTLKQFNGPTTIFEEGSKQVIYTNCNFVNIPQPAQKAEAQPTQPTATTPQPTQKAEPTPQPATQAATAPKQADYCSYIVPNAIKSEEEIEKGLAQAAYKNAPALVNYIRNAVKLGYMDLRGDSARVVYEEMKKRYGITYSYSNWTTYFYRRSI